MSKKTRLIIPEGARYQPRERKRLLLGSHFSPDCNKRNKNPRKTGVIRVFLYI
jgi:hypothetical protein